MCKSVLPNGIRIGAQFINLLVLALGLAGGYFMTIQSLRLDLAAKAESAVVETLDKRLAQMEIVIRESTVSRTQFYDFTTGVDRRLARIEYHLSDLRGDERETP